MAQSLARVYLHVIFSTKNREPYLEDAWRDELFQMLGGIAKGVGCLSMTVGGVADHIHMLIQLGRTISIADAMREIKSRSSGWINEKYRPVPIFQWQSGYAVFSLSHSHVEVTTQYIRRQPEHHLKQSFQDELRECLNLYDVEFNEEYIWQD